MQRRPLDGVAQVSGSAQQQLVHNIDFHSQQTLLGEVERQNTIIETGIPLKSAMGYLTDPT